jgi:hypothetical protein
MSQWLNITPVNRLNTGKISLGNPQKGGFQVGYGCGEVGGACSGCGDPAYILFLLLILLVFSMPFCGGEYCTQ